MNGRRRVWPALAGTLALVVLAYFAFGGALPFAGTFEIHARFGDAQELEPGNPVRIAGLQIGSVTSVGAGGGDSAVVNIELDQPQLVHDDATFTIRPRLLFEGNNYVDVSPGTPSASQIADGSQVPASRTSSSVSVQQLLNVFTTPIRGQVQSTAAALAAGLGSPDGHAPAGYQGVDDAARALSEGLGSLTVSVRSLRGTQAGDLDRTVADTGQMAAELARSPAVLSDFVTSYNRVFGALAGQGANIEASLQQMVALLSAATPQLRSVDAALPHLTTFATAVQPALKLAPRALQAAGSALGQLDATVAPSQLPALLSDLAPVTESLPELEQRLATLMPRITSVAKCVQNNVVPALDMVVPARVDGSGRPAWQDLVHLGAALAGASPDFDGNGTTIRLGVTENELSLSTILPGEGKVVGVGANGIEGIQPEPLGPGVIPPLRPDQPCDKQPLPNLSLRTNATATSFTSNRVPSLSPFMQQLGRELFGGTVAGRGRALSQLLSLVPSTAHHPRSAAPVQRSPRGSSAGSPSSTSPVELEPRRPSAPPSGATGTPLLPIHISLPGLGTTGATGSLGQTINRVLGGLLGALHR